MTVPLGSGRSPRKKSANVITTISGPTDPGRLSAASSTSPRRRAQHIQRNRLDRRRINTEPAGHAPRLLILRRVPFSHAVVLLSILNLLSLISSPGSSAGAVYLYCLNTEACYLQRARTLDATMAQGLRKAQQACNMFSTAFAASDFASPPLNSWRIGSFRYCLPLISGWSR